MSTLNDLLYKGFFCKSLALNLVFPYQLSLYRRRRSGVFIVNFDKILQIVFLLLTLNK